MPIRCGAWQVSWRTDAVPGLSSFFLEVRMKEKRANEIFRDSDAGVTHGSDNRSGAPIPQDSQSFASEGSGSEATIEDTAKQPSRVKKASGPRTAEGKQRSKRNALKHGIFSKIA